MIVTRGYGYEPEASTGVVAVIGVSVDMVNETSISLSADTTSVLIDVDTDDVEVVTI